MISQQEHEQYETCGIFKRKRSHRPEEEIHKIPGIYIFSVAQLWARWGKRVAHFQAWKI